MGKERVTADDWSRAASALAREIENLRDMCKEWEGISNHDLLMRHDDYCLSISDVALIIGTRDDIVACEKAFRNMVDRSQK